MTGHSTATITDYIGHFSDLVAHDIRESSCVIGGIGVIVEIDETKLGKRKYHKGHRVDGVWVVVGVERTPERKVFTVVVENRSAEVLAEIISTYVASGSIIITDCWRGYSCIENLVGVSHMTVNHSICFRDPETGAHTNTVEGTNCAIKRAVPVRNRTVSLVERHLMSFVWRRQHEHDLWNSFLDALRYVRYE